MAKKNNEVIKEAEKELEYLTGDEEVKRMAFLHEKWERDYNSGMQNAKEEGKIEGKREEKIEMAIKMKKENMPLDLIAKITGLEIKEIEVLI